MISEQDSRLPAVQRSRLISKVLSPAVRLWIRSQVESADALQVSINGGDRQILSGYVPQVTIAAHHVVYQGIALSQVCLKGTDIRINLKDVLQGKPLKLVDIVPVQVEATLNQAHFNASLQTPLLANAVQELVMQWLRLEANQLPDAFNLLLQSDAIELEHPQLAFNPDQLRLWGTLASRNLGGEDRSLPFAFSTGLRMVDRAKIQLEQPQWLPHPEATQGQLLPNLQGFEIDLGTDVYLHKLNLEAGQLICGGIINVIP
jgi:hypothetical protein